MGAERFRDPYSDFVLSQLLTPSTAIKLTRAERSVILAAVRSEVLINADIRNRRPFGIMKHRPRAGETASGRPDLAYLSRLSPS